jgi:hypothetical protein
VTLSSVILKNGATTVGTTGGTASFTIVKAPELPGAVTVTSSTHPDPNTAYEATTVTLDWNKESGVDGFSYLLDQTADTTPAAKITDANTTVTYTDKAIGIYYFHIRAHKTDGWGTTTNFTINIKEPDPKVDSTLSSPSDIVIDKSSDFTNNITDGTVTGLVISCTTEPGYTANFTLTPAPTLPEGKVMSAIADENGHAELLLDFPVAAGFHKLTIQGQKDKVLTPISNEVTFEISQALGGTINILTAEDANAPVLAAEKPDTSIYAKIKANPIIAVVCLIPILGIAALAIILIRKARRRSIRRSIEK